MSKWKFVGSSNNFTKEDLAVSKKIAKTANKMIKNIIIPSYEDMEKKNKQLYAEKVENDAKLLELYEQKKLKSKDLIARAKALKKKATTSK